MFGCRLGDRRFGGWSVGHVAMNRDTLDSSRHFGGGLIVDVEDGDFGAGFRQHACGRGSEAGATACDECRLSANIHVQLTYLVWWQWLRGRRR